MICPRCQTRLSDDTAICDQCNFIIDTGFLGGDITNEAKAPSKADSTQVREVKPQVPEPSPAPGRPAKQDDDEPRGPGRLERIAAPHASVSEAADDIRDEFNKFPLSERLATGAAVAFIVSLGLPWRYSETDDAIGLFAGVGPLGLVAALVCVAAYVRRGQLRKYTEEILVVALASATVIVGGTAVFFSRSFEKVYVNMAGKAPVQVWKVLPHVGVVIALIAGLLMLVGTAATYRERLRSRA